MLTLRSLSILALIGLWPAMLRAQTPAAPPADLDRYVAQVMEAFKVPGIGLAIVKDGKVVVARGYGVRKLGEPARVDEHTLFGIGSNTKVFTATALGLLVEEGKLEWDAPVIRYLPSFRMSDPFVTNELTIRDLLVHRSGLGLGAGDLLWWPASTYDRKEVVRRLRYIPLATSFRSAYAYDNVLYGVAGEVIEAVTGKTWEQFVGERILARVGMTESVIGYSGTANGGNVAAPHAEVSGAVRPVTPYASPNVNPAGGINASAVDMAKWVMVQLDSGRVAGGSPLFSPRLTREIQTIVTPMPIPTLPPELARFQPNFSGYGLGEDISDFRGRKLVDHTGGLPGYLSRVAMIPSLRLGVVVLTSQESGAAFTSITNWILGHYLGESFDWLGLMKRRSAGQDEAVAQALRAAAAARNAASRPSLALEKYAGTYEDRWYGEIGISLDNGKLVMRFSHTPELVGDLEHWQYDTFVARWRNPETRADAYVTFSLNPDGSIDQVKMQAFSPATDFSFDFQDLLLKPVRK